MRYILVSISLFCLLFAATLLVADTNAAPQPATAATEVHRGDIPDLVRETQLSVRADGYSGLIWWIPTEFWVESAIKRGTSVDKAEENFRPMRDYTVVFVFVAKIGGLGNFDFVPPDELKKKVVIRDSSGVDYAALDEVSDAAKNLAAIMKPILTNAMGKTGENVTMLFFPSRTKTGVPIADPKRNGNFAVVLKDVVGSPQDVYEWRLPLTSLSAAKYCPVGKERVNANWSFCPWHGVSLGADTKIGK